MAVVGRTFRPKPAYWWANRTSAAKPKPLNIPENAKESDLHATIAELLDWILIQPAIYTTFPAGWGKLKGATAGRLKKSGLKAGMPDILVFYRGKCVGIELKVNGASPSSVQRTMFAQLQAAGVPVYVCGSISDVIEALNRCRIPFRYTASPTPVIGR
jgi:hypothetical protein